MKKIIACTLILLLSFSLAVPALANTKTMPERAKTDFCIDDYNQYTINFTENNVKKNNEDVNEEPQCDNIDAAIEYVQSLNLDEIGYSHIEEACLIELDSYKDDDIVLENYTVLVPKARAKNYYGTYLGSKFYYEYTSVSDMMRKTKGTEKNAYNKSKWDSWVKGGLDLAVTFINERYGWTLLYSVIAALSGLHQPGDIDYGSYNLYTERYNDLRTRTIYKLNGSTYRACFQDQTGRVRVDQTFCPIDVDDPVHIELGTMFNKTVTSTDMTQNEILKVANTYANHGGKIVHLITTERLKEKWV